MAIALVYNEIMASDSIQGYGVALNNDGDLVKYTSVIENFNLRTLAGLEQGDSLTAVVQEVRQTRDYIGHPVNEEHWESWGLEKK